MTVPLALVLHVAAACGPGMPVDTLAAVTRAESGLNPLAIGDASAGRSQRPRSPATAVAEATALLRRGHALDLGLMPLNSTTQARLGLGVVDAVEPCRNIAAGAEVLAAGFAPRGGEDRQQALVRALSRTNTGSHDRGAATGYVARVRAAAATVVPVIRQEGAARPEADGPASAAPPPPAAAPPEPPAWDVYAQARRARERSPPPPSPTAPVSHPPDRPPAGKDRR